MLDSLGDIVALGTSAATGGVFGAIGVGIQAVVKLFSDRQAAQRDIELRRLDIEELRESAKLAIEKAESEARGAAEVARINAQAEERRADADLQKASYEHDEMRYGGGKVDAIRGLMRPFITAYYMLLEAIVAGAVVYAAYKLQLKPTPDQIWTLVTTIVNSIVFLATMSVTWWLGSRPLRITGK